MKDLIDGEFYVNSDNGIELTCKCIDGELTTRFARIVNMDAFIRYLEREGYLKGREFEHDI